MFNYISVDLFSVLKFLSVNFISGEMSNELSRYDINKLEDQDLIIKNFVLPQYCLYRKQDRDSFIRLLRASENFPEKEVREILDEVGMPFDEELHDYKSFFERIIAAFENFEKMQED